MARAPTPRLSVTGKILEQLFFPLLGFPLPLLPLLLFAGVISIITIVGIKRVFTPRGRAISDILWISSSTLSVTLLIFTLIYRGPAQQYDYYVDQLETIGATLNVDITKLHLQICLRQDEGREEIRAMCLDIKNYLSELNSALELLASHAQSTLLPMRGYSVACDGSEECSYFSGEFYDVWAKSELIYVYLNLITELQFAKEADEKLKGLQTLLVCFVSAAAAFRLMRSVDDYVKAKKPKIDYEGAET